MPHSYCSFCIGHPILDYKHVRSHQHMNNIRKLPMEEGNEWWKIPPEELFIYLNKNSIDKYNGRKKITK